MVFNRTAWRVFVSRKQTKTISKRRNEAKKKGCNAISMLLVRERVGFR